MYLNYFFVIFKSWPILATNTLKLFSQLIAYFLINAFLVCTVEKLFNFCRLYFLFKKQIWLNLENVKLCEWNICIYVYKCARTQLFIIIPKCLQIQL